MFISVEGIDNVGKSTICDGIKESLESRNWTVVLVHDPPKEEPWKSWKETIEGNREMRTPARAMLYFAARLDAVARVIQPAFEPERNCDCTPIHL